MLGEWTICGTLIGPSCQRTLLLELKSPATAKPSTPREISTNRLGTKGRRSEATATYRYLSHLSNPFPLPTLILIIKTIISSSPNSILGEELSSSTSVTFAFQNHIVRQALLFYSKILSFFPQAAHILFLHIHCENQEKKQNRSY